MNRPYFNHSGDKLEKEYRSALKRSDIECLELIATELTHRKTQRALELSEKVQDSLTRLRKKESAPIPSVPKSESLTSPSSRPPKKPSRPTTTPRNRTHTPTLEQAQAIEAFRTGGSLRINAYAGTGKTATLEMLAHSTHRIGQYIAFNRNIVDEAKNKFPEAVNCSTIHGLAFRATPSQYKNNQDKMMGKVNAHKLADLLNLSEEWRVDQNVTLDRVAQAGIILKTVQKFAQSEEADPIESHVPRHGSLLGASESTFRTVQDFALRGARHIWGRMLDANDQLPLGHDGYLKLWALSEPHIAADFILLDEAQDTNPVVLKVLKRQTAQMVYVGDRYQQIYEWRGAVNAMEEINTTHQTHLRRSFRFGDGIAEAATKVLALLGEQSPIQGNPAVSSFLCPTTPDAILARTNATTITALLAALDAKQLPHLVGGNAELMELLKGVSELKKGIPSSVPEFFGFQNWNEVVAFAETPEGESLVTFVNLVQSRGEKQLMWALSRIVEEDSCDIIISTAHKAKGREWSKVLLMDDFLKSTQRKGADGRVETKQKHDPAELRLFYVAMTRAREELEFSPTTMQLLGINVPKSFGADYTASQFAGDQTTRQGNPARSSSSHSTPRPAWTPPSDWKPSSAGGALEPTPGHQSAAHPTDPRTNEPPPPKGIFRRLFG